MDRFHATIEQDDEGNLWLKVGLNTCPSLDNHILIHDPDEALAIKRLIEAAYGDFVGHPPDADEPFGSINVKDVMQKFDDLITDLKK